MTLTFEPVRDGAALRVHDPIERHQYTLTTSEAAAPVEADVHEFMFPVDDAVSITTASIDLPTVVGVLVRDASGALIAEAKQFADISMPEGVYSLELPAPIKLYLRVDSAVTVESDDTQTSISFGEPTEVLVGARSHHKHPEATITTTDDPRDVMAAVSYLGSALKTTSPERSFPTLRGHPPAIELGDELDVPDVLERPDTGVTLELPLDLGTIFVAAPLAYYLGADVVPGPTPRLVTDDGFEYDLDGPLGYETEVERVLKQVFFFDCVTRTEGVYPVELHERRELEALVDLDYADLYDRSIGEQVAAYLQVPFEVIEEHVPEWKLTTHVASTADSVELLPFVVDDLAVIRSATAIEPGAGSEAQEAAVADFMRTDDFTRSASEASTGPATVQPEQATSLEQAWVGDGAPMGASKASLEAFRNRVDREPSDGDIDITVVCNDVQMTDEHDTVNEVYGSRSDLPFDVEVHNDLTVAELRDVLSTRTDFLHYIGHIDDEGFQCADGKLDVTTLDEVNVDAFFLNACSSYEQGMALIERGSIGGVVTLTDVVNSGAVRIGSTLARLLNRGFPLRAGLEIARGESIMGSQYIVVGDGGLAITQAESGTPILCEIDHVDDDTFELTVKGFPTNQAGMGSLLMPLIDGVEEHYLSSGDLNSFEMSREQLTQTLLLEDMPVMIDGQLRWTADLGFDTL
ncbi:hypothetical protein ACFQH6_08375 [Halobacteriaceae archaeon GCM10025711]